MKTLVEYARCTPFIVCAHRGASGVAPENTISALQAALDSGAMMIELDVQTTSDGALVVFHDEQLDRTTNGHGFIRQCTLDDVQALDAGSWFSSQFKDEHIPLLAEALQLVRGRAYVNIEMKPLIASEESARIIYAIVQTVVDCQMRDYVVFASFDHHALLFIKSIDPHLSTIALNVPHDERLPHDVVRTCHADAYGCSLEELSRERVEDCKSHHIPIGVYTVNSTVELEYALKMGVQGVVSNYPDAIMSHYRSRTK